MKHERIESASKYLHKILSEEGFWRSVCQALVDRAIAGDLKAIEFILATTGENGPHPEVYRVELGPGVEELAK